MAKRKYKKATVKEPEPESEVCETCGKEPCVCKAEEVIEEILEEVPEAEVVVEERELPKEVGEETSETVMLGGRLMRIIKSADGTSYKPLQNDIIFNVFYVSLL